ncbi:MAG TPA: ATP-binding protein [Actinoplanes sp.]|nr:ATP-binding protein [Actinoplanes sp.]
MNSPDAPAHRTGDPAVAAFGVFDLEQTFDSSGLYRLRETLAAHASRIGADEDQIDSLLIVASELATNAVRHGGGTGRLRLWHHDDRLHCQVSDHGPGNLDPTAGSTLPGPQAGDGGRGLWICRRLSTDFDIRSGPDGRGVTVTAVLAGTIRPR